jgi:hypothetical protein
MKYLFAIIFITFYISGFGQDCKTAYIHTNPPLDSLEVPPAVQGKIDSFRAVMDEDLIFRESRLQSKIKDKKALKKKIRQQKRQAADSVKAYKYKLMNKVYGAKIRDASLKIYDKGKKYESVFNADNKFFSKIPKNSCDVTQECLRMVREGK